MNKEEMYKLMNENPICHLATVESDAPRVRGMHMYAADERGILIQLGSMKDLYKQLLKNPKVELCFNDFKSGVQLRVSGTAEFLEEQALKEEVLKIRPFLKPLVDAQGIDVIKVFRVANAVATTWTMATNLAPKEYTKL
ncbi:MAG: Pyridoxamine 5'-phosphate oxidase [Syntrophorhabdaceae bacterium PtaU1.Bin034]|jgi:uncharacterized pyridoxamine 5'-phosphate oxidase family protein|nr:MAG: Pyridoxamine 5'-phosphate oxidase [Syntrophorhabdaceae bacterium PtaU1.Bin034]